MPLTKCSTNARPQDLDATLEAIQPPPELLAALKPSPLCNVSEFLVVRQPPRPSSRKHTLKSSSWFSRELPNSIPADIHDLVLPSEKLCENLDGDLRDAVKNGMQSIEHPVKIGVFLPLWVARAWKWGNVLVKKQKLWRARLDWVRETAAEESWSQELQDNVTATVMSTPWHTGYHALLNGTVSTTTLVLLLSNEWLNDEQMGCIADLIRADMAASGVDLTTHLASNFLATSFESPGKTNTDTLWGERLRNGVAKNLYVQCNIQNVHWISLEIDVARRTLNFGDSLPSVTQKTSPIFPVIQTRVTRWLDYYLPNGPWCTNLKGIRCPIQLDKSSCGIATSRSAIHHRLVPSAPKWDPKKPGKSRAYYFCRCIALGQGVGPLSHNLSSVY
jgi:hypothetical protein